MASQGVSAVAKRLYYDDPGLSFEAVVTEIQLVAQERSASGEKVQLWRVALDQTAFYPESGGQPWDTGTLLATARSGAQLEVAVERVEEDEDGQVWHFVRKPLLEDTVVRGAVDGARRLDHTQQHSGQHLLSAIFLSHLGMGTNSFHLGAEVSTIDLAASDERAFGGAELAEAEDLVNGAIAANHPLRLHLIAAAEAEAMLARGELRKLPARTGPFRVVEIEGVEWNACGGTHVRSTGEIGCVLLRRWEKVRQGVRVEFVCGLRAVRRSRAEFAALQQGAQLLGTGWNQVAERVQSVVSQQKAGGKRLAALQAELAKGVAREMLQQSEAGTLYELFEERDADFVRGVASGLSGAGRNAVIGAAMGEEAWVSVSTAGTDGRHAGELLRGIATPMGIRGGGGATLAQASCRPDQLQAFAASLMAALAD